MKKAMVISVAAILLTGCAARSITKMAKDKEKQDAHAEPVCMLKSPLPSDVAYTVIGEVRGSNRWYGSVNEVLAAMGDEARKIGADAIVNLKTGHRVGAWAWARPVGSGTGIKLANKADLDCLKMGGEFR